MLAATRARPSAISDEVRACDGMTTNVVRGGVDAFSFGDSRRKWIGAPFSTKGGGTLPDEALAAAGDRRGGRFAGVLGSELAARRADLLPSVAANRDGQARPSEPRGELCDARHRAGGPW